VDLADGIEYLGRFTTIRAGGWDDCRCADIVMWLRAQGPSPARVACRSSVDVVREHCKLVSRYL